MQLPASTPAPSATGAVQLLVPGGGIDRALLKAFSRRTGVAVRVVAPAEGVTLPEALSLDASCDVVLAPDHLVPVLGGQRLLRPLEMTLVGNFDYVQGAFRSPPYDDGDPTRFSVPFQFRTLGLGVRPDALDGSPRAWSDLWQPRFRRRVRFAVRGRSVVGIGLLSLGFPLGSTDRRQIDRHRGTSHRSQGEPAGPRRGHARRAGHRLLELPGAEDGQDGIAAGACASSCRPTASRSTPTHCAWRARRGTPVAAHRFLDFCLRPACSAGSRGVPGRSRRSPRRGCTCRRWSAPSPPATCSSFTGEWLGIWARVRGGLRPGLDDGGEGVGYGGVKRAPMAWGRRAGPASGRRARPRQWRGAAAR